MYSANSLKIKPAPSMLDAALDLIARKINPVPVEYPSEMSRGKNPSFGKDWQTVVITAEAAPRYFGNGKTNLGGMMGALSAGLTDVDNDCPEAITAAPYLLPRTGMLFGRPSTPMAHWLYTTNLASTVDKAAIAYDDPVAKRERRKCRLVELRIGGGGKGAQTVFPPSTHETGEIIAWEKNGAPAVADGAFLERRVAMLAACALIARYWPGEGVRQEAALALGGFLSRAGKQPQAIKLMVEAVAKAANDEEWKQRIEGALTSDKNLRDGEKNVFGLPKLGEHIGAEIANTVAAWLGYRGETCLPRTMSVSADTPKAPEDWPEPTPLPTGLSPVPELNSEMLPKALAPWLRDIAERMQVPLDFLAAPAMAVFGSVIGCKVGIRPKQQDDWTEVANVWALIIGRPGFMKSPAVGEILRPMYRSAEDAAETYSALAKEYELDAEIYKHKRSAAAKKGQRIADPESAEPTQRRYFTNDSTYEKLCEILRDNPSGTLLHRDEVVSLLRYLDHEEHSQARGFYLTAWSGTQRYDTDRVGRGAIHVSHACISLLGTTQPGTISEYVRRATVGGRGDDGMIQRFGLVAWPDTSPEWKNVDRYPLMEPRDAAWKVFRRLDAATPAELGATKEEYDRIPWLRFTNEAQAEFEPWREKLETRVRSGELSPAIESHVAKYRGLIPRLALITHLIDVGRGPVGKEAVLCALVWAEYLEAHALRLYGAGVEPARAAARAILAKICGGDLKDRFTARDVHQRNWAGLTERERVQAGVDLLCDHCWMAPITVETGGRPRVAYAINPKVRV